MPSTLPEILIAPWIKSRFLDGRFSILLIESGCLYTERIYYKLFKNNNKKFSKEYFPKYQHNFRMLKELIKLTKSLSIKLQSFIFTIRCTKEWKRKDKFYLKKKSFKNVQFESEETLKV